MPDIALQYHKHLPKKLEDGETEYFCRYDVTVNNKTTAFVPHGLTDDILASPTLKRGLFGALFKGKFDKLPSTNGAIVFEVEPKLDPPCHIRAVRPKFWFLGELELKPGIMYKLV